MSTELLRLIESMHGHVGALAAVALLHPAVLLWKGRPATRGVRLSIALTTLLVTLAFGMGIGIYGDYRAVVKRPLFRDDLTAGLLFETKEHLAWIALAGALGAGVAGLVAPARAARARQVAARVFLGAAVACALTVLLGTWIASVRSF